MRASCLLWKRLRLAWYVTLDESYSSQIQDYPCRFCDMQPFPIARSLRTKLFRTKLILHSSHAQIGTRGTKIDEAVLLACNLRSYPPSLIFRHAWSQVNLRVVRMRIKLLVGILATQATRHSVLPSHGLERQCEHDTYCLIEYYSSSGCIQSTWRGWMSLAFRTKTRKKTTNHTKTNDALISKIWPSLSRK